MAQFFSFETSEDWENNFSSNDGSNENEWEKVESKKRAMTEQTDFVVVIRHSETRFSFDYWHYAIEYRYYVE